MMKPNDNVGRMIAIGDIHGCGEALQTLIQAIAPQPHDTIVTLGDYIDRGPDSYGVIEQLLKLQSRLELIPLIGNHERMLDLAREHPETQTWWESVGGLATLESYLTAQGFGDKLSMDDSTRSARPVSQNENDDNHDSEPVAQSQASDPDVSNSWSTMTPLRELIPSTHQAFFDSCALAYETDTHIFVHANYDATRPLDEQSEEVLLWKHLTAKQIPKPHVSGKRVIVGHTPQVSGEILDLNHIVCIDTFCFGDGWLTGLDVHTNHVWQANQQGDVRDYRMGAASE